MYKTNQYNMAGFNSFMFWRRNDGPDLRKQISELEKKLQERAVTVTGLEELLDKRHSES
jgi:hypothetical protein